MTKPTNPGTIKATNARLRALGLVVEAYVPIGSGGDAKENPYVIRTLGSDATFGRFPSWTAAVAEIEECMASPDHSSIKSHAERMAGTV